MSQEQPPVAASIRCLTESIAGQMVRVEQSGVSTGRDVSNTIVISGDHLLGSGYTCHGSLYSLYSQADASNRLLFAWGALRAINIVLMVVTAVSLKRKDNVA